MNQCVSLEGKRKAEGLGERLRGWWYSWVSLQSSPD